MFNFFKKKSNKNQDVDILSKTASLLIHAAKIDENYTNNEKIIIEKTLLNLGANKEKLAQLMMDAEKFEKNGGPHRPQQKGVLLIKKFIYIEVPQKVFLTPQHNFYSVWYQSKTGLFQNLFGPTWILLPPVTTQHGRLKMAT